MKQQAGEKYLKANVVKGSICPGIVFVASSRKYRYVSKETGCAYFREKEMSGSNNLLNEFAWNYILYLYNYLPYFRYLYTTYQV